MKNTSDQLTIPQDLPVFESDEGDDAAYIIIRQLPVIEERLAALGEEVDKQVQAALALECTEASVKTVKQARADLTKWFTGYEEKRKDVKFKIMRPYDQFEDAYKQHVSDKYKYADAQLKSKIDAIEDDLKQKKRDELTKYFNELCSAAGIDFISMATWNPNITLTTTLKALKIEAGAYVSAIADDITLIGTLEYADEVMVEYRRCLSVNKAVMEVKSRHEALEAQKQRQTVAEARKQADQAAADKVDAALPQPLAPPMEAPTQTQTDDDPVRVVAFRVKAPVSKLKAHKQFLIEGGYEIV